MYIKVDIQYWNSECCYLVSSTLCDKYSKSAPYHSVISFGGQFVIYLLSADGNSTNKQTRYEYNKGIFGIYILLHEIESFYSYIS